MRPSPATPRSGSRLSSTVSTGASPYGDAMKTKPASTIVQLALDHLGALTLAKQSEIAAVGRQVDGMSEEWLLDPVQGVWVLPDASPAQGRVVAVPDPSPQPGGKNATQDDDATGRV